MQVSTTKTIRSLLAAGLASTLPDARRGKQSAHLVPPPPPQHKASQLPLPSHPGPRGSRSPQVGSGSRPAPKPAQPCRPGGLHHAAAPRIAPERPRGSGLTARPGSLPGPQLRPGTRKKPQAQSCLGAGVPGIRPRSDLEDAPGQPGSAGPVQPHPPPLAHSRPRGQPPTSDGSA